MTHPATDIRPYHAVPGADPDSGRRLLVVSYHFPPSPAVGGLRWQQLSLLAAERGWGVDVLARDPEEFRVNDESRLLNLPPGLRAFGVRTPQLTLDAFERVAAGALRSLRSSRDGEATNSGGTAPGTRDQLPRTLPRSEVGWKATPEAVVDWIDVGAGEASQRFWTLDPIDGTKGFLRGEQYSVCLALIEHGEVVLGAIGCPNLNVQGGAEIGGPGSIYVAGRGQGAWVVPLEGDAPRERLQVSSVATARDARLLRSVETGEAVEIASTFERPGATVTA